MSKRVVLVPSTFEGPWKVGFSCPIAVSPTGQEPRTHLVVVVPDDSVTLPKEAAVIPSNPGELAFEAVARAGLHIVGRGIPQPPAPAELPPPVILQEPVILPEPSIVPPPTVIPSEPVVLETPFFSRVINFFKRP